MMLLADNPTIFILVGIAALILVWFIGTYNRILRHRNHLAESWSDIDVELKRRYDLIPNRSSLRKSRGCARMPREIMALQRAKP